MEAVDINTIRQMVRQVVSRLPSDPAIDLSLNKKSGKKSDKKADHRQEQKKGSISRIIRNPDGPKILTVFHAGIFRLDEALEQVRQMNQSAWKFSVFRGGSSHSFISTKKLQNITQVKCFLDKARPADLIKVLDHCDILVLPTFGFPAAAKVAKLLCDDCESRIIHAALAKGKKVLAVKDGYKDPDVKVAPLLIEETQRIFNKLEGFGVTFCETGQLSAWCKKLCLNSFEPESIAVPGQDQFEKNDLQGKRLITGKDIEKAAQSHQKEVQLAPKGKVTPLARDLAKEYSINILTVMQP